MGNNPRQTFSQSVLAPSLSEPASTRLAGVSVLGGSRPFGSDRTFRIEDWHVQRASSEHGPERVILHIYDVSDDSRVQLVNEIFRPVGTGVFHAGVEVYGQEWSFGFRNDQGTGMFCCHPRENPAHHYREQVEMGCTDLGRAAVARILQRLQREWLGRGYDLFSRNCTHFCDALCHELGVGSMPTWLTNLADTGASVVSGIELAAAGAQALRRKAQEMDQCFHLWNTAETTARGFMDYAQGASPDRAKISDARASGPNLNDPPANAACQILGGCNPPAEDVGSIARDVMSAVSQLWEGNQDAGSSIDVVLECLQSSCTDISTLPKAQRCIGRRVEERRAWSVGPRQQPSAFGAILRGYAKVPWSFLFEIAWEPPCLFLRKPSADAPLKVNGAMVRQQTFVLLDNVVIEVGVPGNDLFLSFRLVRESVKEGLEELAPKTPGQMVASRDTSASRTLPHQRAGIARTVSRQMSVHSLS